MHACMHVRTCARVCVCVCVCVLRSVPFDEVLNVLLFLLPTGVGDQVNRAELEGIANSPSSSYVFEVDTFDALTKIQKELVETSCEEDPSEYHTVNLRQNQNQKCHTDTV